MPRSSGRLYNETRAISFEVGVTKYGDGSCFVKFGDTHLLCIASLEKRVPAFLRNSGTGWITAEYGMLPRSTNMRMEREAVIGKQSGRTQEIQRLIGRSLRSVADLSAMGEMQLKIDCDVIQADGGTRTAAICGAYVAAHRALNRFSRKGSCHNILKDYVTAISCGVVNNEVLIDLDYVEDSSAAADANFVFSGCGDLIEVQMTAERHPCSAGVFTKMLDLSKETTRKILELQKIACR